MLRYCLGARAAACMGSAARGAFALQQLPGERPVARAPRVMFQRWCVTQLLHQSSARNCVRMQNSRGMGQCELGELGKSTRGCLCLACTAMALSRRSSVQVQGCADCQARLMARIAAPRPAASMLMVSELPPFQQGGAALPHMVCHCCVPAVQHAAGTTGFCALLQQQRPNCDKDSCCQA